jgi:hypothetical protein
MPGLANPSHRKRKKNAFSAGTNRGDLGSLAAAASSRASLDRLDLAALAFMERPPA